MYIWQLFLLMALAVALLLFLPELVPRCSCCRKVKPRFLFRIHKLTGISPGYRGNTSVCKACCRKYDIESLSDLENVKRIQKSLRSRLWSNFRQF